MKKARSSQVVTHHTTRPRYRRHYRVAGSNDAVSRYFRYGGFREVKRGRDWAGLRILILNILTALITFLVTSIFITIRSG
jgi:hypothetical protein